MSFYTSLSGLKGAQTDLATVSNNIANVGSYGFKKSRAEFGDLVSSSRTTAGQGTRLKSIQQQFNQGGFEASSRELDIAISGNGFLVTRDELTGGSTKFTRNGALSIDTDRDLVGAGGGYVQVLPTDDPGNVTSTGIASARNLQIPITSGDPAATTNVAINLQLPQAADLPATRSVYTASNPYAFDRTDPNSYNHSTQEVFYDSAGTAFPATVYFIRTKAPDATDTTSRWATRLFVGDEEVSSVPATPTPPTPLTLVFDAAGTLTAPTAGTTYASVLPAGAVAPLDITIDYGTATNQGPGQFVLRSLDQDGATSGKLDDVSISEEGVVTATFSNGTTRALGKLLLANFANPAGLKQRGDAQWSVTGDSGDAIVGEAGRDGLGTIQTGALERANVDVTEELVALISAQRNFQANAKAIETAGAMTQAIINLRT